MWMVGMQQEDSTPGRWQELGRRSRPGYRFLAVALLLIVGVVLSVYFYLRAERWENLEIRTHFERIAVGRVAAFRKTAESNIHALEALRALYASSVEVERSEFREFCQHLLLHFPAIQALEWVPRVPAGQRSEVVAAARRQGYPDFRITERLRQGVMVPAKQRAEYYPVFFLEPYQGNEAAMGYDLGSDPVRRELMRQAGDSGMVLASPRVVLVQEMADDYSFLMALAVYRPHEVPSTVAERRRNLTGFVLGVFRLQDIMESSLDAVPLERMDLALLDDSAPAGKRLLYFRQAAGSIRQSWPDETKLEQSEPFYYSEGFTLAGRSWRLLCLPLAGYVATGKTWQPAAILWGGILLSLLLTGYFAMSFIRIGRAQQFAAEMLSAKQRLEYEISERRLAETALRESEERYRDLFESASDLIQIVRPDGRIQYVNRAWRQTLGYGEEEIRDLSLENVLDPECSEECVDTFKKVIAEGRLNLIEAKFRSQNGRQVLLQGSATCKYENGQPVSVRCIFRDVTEQKEIEAELNKAQKLESLSIMAGGIAHDFNNLLTAILGNIDLALFTAGEEGPAAQRLREARIASLRAKDLTQQMLAFSKGGLPIKKTRQIGELIRETAAFALRGSNCRAEIGIATDLWPVEIDEGQMSQVFHNLFINAQQAMPQGGVIRVVSENIEVADDDMTSLLPGRYVRIAIIDKGVGIPRAHLAKIFDPYFTTKHAGSGLGLATAYSIINRHGGVLTVESESGIGSTFTLCLPASAERSLEQKSEDAPPVSGQGRILLMDDDEMVRKVAREMLRSLGYQVETAGDGFEAIGKYCEARDDHLPFDVVIMDLTIAGGMGGLEAMRRLLEIDPQIKAIVSSGYSTDPVMADYRRYGFVGVMSKPYQIKDISEALREVLSDS